MSFTVFNKVNVDHMTQPMFLGECGNVLRFDEQKYSVFEKLRDKQLSFFWRPEEVDLSSDKIQFTMLPSHEQHIFLSNLRLQTLADSLAGRAISVSLVAACSLPELETWYELIAGWESAIHAQSYSHIIRNVFTEPDEVFDGIMDIPEVVARASQLGDTFDEAVAYTTQVQCLGFGTHTVDGRCLELDVFTLKCLLYKAIVALYILEGIRFYASFACSFAFAERELMEGNAKVIKFIARDEALHAEGGKHVLKILHAGRDDPDFIKVVEHCRPAVVDMFNLAEEEECAWADFLFKEGSMVGLNAAMLKEYVHYLTAMRKNDIGYDCPVVHNPLPWMAAWIDSDNVQVAPQEAEMSSYLVGAIDTQMGNDAFGEFEL